jgi:hypothetical protein
MKQLSDFNKSRHNPDGLQSYCRSCGSRDCKERYIPHPRNPDMVGKRFGRLVVLSFSHRNEGKQAFWLCQCDCGNQIITQGYSITSGATKSCGCLCSEINKTVHTTHGKYYTRIHKIYSYMMTRCYNKKSDAYNNYGGRGIMICDEWKNDFISFYNWAYQSGYQDNLTIERIDVNGNYCPENCTWIPLVEQGKNKTTMNLIEYEGEVHYVTEWARIKGFKSPFVIFNRLKLGWSIEKIFNTPVRECKRRSK